jgi:UDP-N-acetylglucosamine 2-epimerase (non-hydrolysing)
MKISVVFGTRPEAIKLAPLILALRREPTVRCRVCVTAQHREMLDQVLQVFEITPDDDLDLMQPNQSLARLTAAAIEALDGYLRSEKPDVVIVQGDTTTTFSCALAAFYNDVPVAHVEAGLRTRNLKAPWPEEANRVLTSRLSALHFAPTETNRGNLLEEGVSLEQIHVTGNTVIDALLLARDKVRSKTPEIPEFPGQLFRDDTQTPVVLITAHRRESFGTGLESMCRAIDKLVRMFSGVQFVYPVHRNPNVRRIVKRMLGANGSDARPLENLHLIDPVDYLPFVALMDRATLILTDSGGIQEEAPTLGKPVLVMRETTERPEAVEAGAVKLVGTNTEDIVREASRLLTDAAAYRAMARARNPYGDGKASERIIRILLARVPTASCYRARASRSAVRKSSTTRSAL